jgi:hypothetical protein
MNPKPKMSNGNSKGLKISNSLNKISHHTNIKTSKTTKNSKTIQTSETSQNNQTIHNSQTKKKRGRPNLKSQVEVPLKSDQKQIRKDIAKKESNNSQPRRKGRNSKSSLESSQAVNSNQKVLNNEDESSQQPRLRGRKRSTPSQSPNVVNQAVMLYSSENSNIGQKLRKSTVKSFPLQQAPELQQKNETLESSSTQQHQRRNESLESLLETVVQEFTNNTTDEFPKSGQRGRKVNSLILKIPAYQVPNNEHSQESYSTAMKTDQNISSNNDSGFQSDRTSFDETEKIEDSIIYRKTRKRRSAISLDSSDDKTQQLIKNNISLEDQKNLENNGTKKRKRFLVVKTDEDNLQTEDQQSKNDEKTNQSLREQLGKLYHSI